VAEIPGFLLARERPRNASADFSHGLDRGARAIMMRSRLLRSSLASAAGPQRTLSPAEIFLRSKRLALLIDPHLAFENMTYHRVGIGGPIVFDPGCMMMSRSETVLNPGIIDGLSP